MSLFKTNNYSKPKCVKTVYGCGKEPNKSKIKKQFEEENITKNTRNLFKLKKENKTIKDRIIRYIKTLPVQQEDDYYKACC